MSDNIFFNIAFLKKCGKNVIIGKTVRIRNPELVEIGDNVIIDDFCYISGSVIIGDYVHIGASSTLSASKSKITLKPFSGVSSGCRVFAGSSNYLKGCLDMPTIPERNSFGSIFKEVTLGNYCLIGANTVVLPGVNLPNGVAFGANLVVNNSKYKEWTLITSEKTYPRRGKEKIMREVAKFYKEKES
jgi:acetyltransferase-like isoleucine patch superfamily enzyme